MARRTDATQRGVTCCLFVLNAFEVYTVASLSLQRHTGDIGLQQPKQVAQQAACARARKRKKESGQGCSIVLWT